MKKNAKFHIHQCILSTQRAQRFKKIIDFIRTHHGTTAVNYFHKQFKKENPGENISDTAFHYPGPIPFNKETAILMMADGVEAASRSLKVYNAISIIYIYGTEYF